MGNCYETCLKSQMDLMITKKISSWQASVPPVAAHSSPQVLGRISDLLFMQPSPQDNPKIDGNGRSKFLSHAKVKEFSQK